MIGLVLISQRAKGRRPSKGKDRNDSTIELKKGPGDLDAGPPIRARPHHD